MVVCLKPEKEATGMLALNLKRLGLPPTTGLIAEELLAGGVEAWPAGKARVALGPERPAAIYRLSLALGDEEDPASR